MATVPVITLENVRCPSPVVSLPRFRSLVLRGTLATRIYLYTPALRELYLERLNADFEFPVLNPDLPLPSRKPIDLLLPPRVPQRSHRQAQMGTLSFPAPEIFCPPSSLLAFGFECAFEDGGSNDELSNYSQSPHSDHVTGMDLRSLLRHSSPPLGVPKRDYANMRAKDFAWLFSRA
jgi:hypothetical protein